MLRETDRHTLTSSPPSFNRSASAGATVVDVVVVVVVVAFVLFAGTLPKINAVALSALAHPTIPIMANETIDITATTQKKNEEALETKIFNAVKCQPLNSIFESMRKTH